MFGEGLTDPCVFPVFCTDDDDQVVPCGIVGVGEIGDEADEAQAAGQDDELIILSELLEELLLVDLEGRRKREGRGKTKTKKRKERYKNEKKRSRMRKLMKLMALGMASHESHPESHPTRTRGSESFTGCTGCAGCGVPAADIRGALLEVWSRTRHPHSRWSGGREWSGWLCGHGTDGGCRLGGFFPDGRCKTVAGVTV